MKHAFLVTSSIEIDPAKNFKGVPKRTVFSTKERLDQTIATLLNLYEKDSDAAIYLIDLIKDVEIVDWTVDGWCGVTGKGVRY